MKNVHTIWWASKHLKVVRVRDKAWRIERRRWYLHVNGQANNRHFDKDVGKTVKLVIKVFEDRLLYCVDCERNEWMMFSKVK